MKINVYVSKASPSSTTSSGSHRTDDQTSESAMTKAHRKHHRRKHRRNNRSVNPSSPDDVFTNINVLLGKLSDKAKLLEKQIAEQEDDELLVHSATNLMNKLEEFVKTYGK